MNTTVEPSKAVGMNARRLERILPAMQAYVDRGVYAGITTLVARRGKVVHAGQFGWRDKEAGRPMTADTIFRLYSMTKPIICTALMTLFEEGRFRLVDPVAKYIPAFGAVKVREADGSLVAPVRPMTVGDVMAHTSGLTYHFLGDSPVSADVREGMLLDAERSLAAAIDDLARFPLAFQPGSRWQYSVGIDVAARLIEVISGQPLGEVLAGAPVRAAGHDRHGLRRARRRSGTAGRHVWAPDVISARRDHAQRVRGLDGRASTTGSTCRRPIRSTSRKCSSAAATASSARSAIISASPRCCATAGELDGARIIGRKTLELMHANRAGRAAAARDRRPAAHGLWLRPRLAGGARHRATSAPGSVGEFGWSGAAKTHYWVDPKEEIVALFMTQSMMSFDLPELELRALAYQAIED